MHDADQEILDYFSYVREKSINVVNRIPEEMLTRVAEGETQNMASLFAHIAGGVDWWMSHVMCDGKASPKYKTDKDSLAAALRSSRDRLLEFFEAKDGVRMGQTFSFTDPDGAVSTWTGRNRVLYLTEHDLHHHGRIILALRQWQFDNIPEWSSGP